MEIIFPYCIILPLIILKVIVMLAVDGLAGVVTWTPYYIWLMVDSFYISSQSLLVHHKQKTTMIIMFSVLTLINCFITPIIYLICNNSYKVQKYINLSSSVLFFQMSNVLHLVYFHNKQQNCIGVIKYLNDLHYHHQK